MYRQGPDFHFEISEFEITRVDCTHNTYIYAYVLSWKNKKNVDLDVTHI